jgi:hypothetical protein
MGKLTDVAIRAWIKAGEGFDGRTVGDGLVMLFEAPRRAKGCSAPNDLNVKPPLLRACRHRACSIRATDASEQPPPEITDQSRFA